MDLDLREVHKALKVPNILNSYFSLDMIEGAFQELSLDQFLDTLFPKKLK
jgi:hypothetical protein